MFELLLISQSPRRRQILEEAGFLFRADTVKISEIIEENVNLRESIAKVAKAKAQAYLDQRNYLKLKDLIVIAADTMVVLEGEAVGKPKNAADAKVILRRLSGKMHSVITGLYLYNLKTAEEFIGSDETMVEFCMLSDQQIECYVKTGEPMDKAGAYGIQGLGRELVKAWTGSYLNVVGLPLEYLEKILSEKGWRVARKSISAGS